MNNTYDVEISPNAINNEFTNDIRKLGPFGNGNPIPIFLIKNLKIFKATLLVINISMLFLNLEQVRLLNRYVLIH